MARIAKDVNLIGTKIGRLVVVSRAEDRIAPRKDGYSRTRKYWNCECECGNTCEVRQDAILAKTSNSCGCLRNEAAKEQIKKAQAVGYIKLPEDLTGMSFGRLTVVNSAPRSVTPKGRELVRWVCLCKCGGTIDVLHDSLKAGKALTCGCVPPNYSDSDFNTHQEVFEHKARQVHFDKYVYDKTEYKHSLKKVCVTCPEHGDFYLTPSNHLQGHGCKLCSYEIFAEKQHYSYLKRCEIDPEFSDRHGCVYVIKLTNNSESFIKIGVSCSRDKRFNSYTSAGFNLEIITIAEMTNYKSAILERKILLSIKENNYKYNPLTDFVGYTECAILRAEEHILGIIKGVNFERNSTLSC